MGASAREYAKPLNQVRRWTIKRFRIYPFERTESTEEDANGEAAMPELDIENLIADLPVARSVETTDRLAAAFP